MFEKKYIWMASVAIFILAFYFVEVGPWSSRAVAKFNEGYGTFDMKHYTPEIVQTILSKMKPEGFDLSYRYYLCDTIFIFAFGWLQFNISSLIYGKAINSRIYHVLFIATVAILILRGMSDMIENSLLVFTLKSYPKVNEGIVTIASSVTQCKLWCIKIWMILCGIGITWNIIFSKLK